MEKENNELKKRLIHFNEVIQMTQNLNKELLKKNEMLEIQNRTLEEELSTLKVNFENLKKRNEQLQKQCTEEKDKLAKKTGVLDWLINTNVKDENSKLKDIINTLQNELEIKIQENESIHMNMFETKQEYDSKFTQLEKDIDNFRLSLHEKITEINRLDNKNNELSFENKKIDNNLRNQIEAFNKLTTEYLDKKDKWKKKKNTLNDNLKTSESFISNLLPYNEYKDRSQNSYNQFHISNEKLREQVKFFNGISTTICNLLHPIDTLIDILIERMNFIYSNTELKKEHRGYIFSCDRIRIHLFSIQQLLRSIFMFIKILAKSNNYKNFLLNLNIIILHLNQSSIYFELVNKYYRIFLSEERRISNIDSDSDFYSNKIKINKDLKNGYNLFITSFKIFIKNLNLIFNFDLDYNIRMISVVSDNTALLIIKVNEKYFENYPYKTNNINYKLLFSKLNDVFGFIRNYFNEFLKAFELKIEIEYKIFETIKEENKNKYNCPIINLHALRTNNENIKKVIKDISINSEGLNTYIQKLEIFLVSSWELDNEYLLNYIKSIHSNKRLKINNNELLKEYSKQENGVSYHEAIKNKRILRDLMEKENMFSRDRENYQNKILEYEDDIRRLHEKLSEEKNNNDLLLISKNELENKITQIKLKGFTEESISLNEERDEKTENSNQFSEFLKFNTDLLSIHEEILSDDVQSGKQRSSFKLSSMDNRPIPLSKFTSQVENNKDVSALYHQKIIEKFQKYSAKIKNIDIKVLAESHSEDIKHEYEIKLRESEKKYEKEMDTMKENIKLLEDFKNGFEIQLNYLNSMLADTSGELNNIKDKIKDCQKCKKYS